MSYTIYEAIQSILYILLKPSATPIFHILDRNLKLFSLTLLNHDHYIQPIRYLFSDHEIKLSHTCINFIYVNYRQLLKTTILQSSAQDPAKLGWEALFSANPTTHMVTQIQDFVKNKETQAEAEVVLSSNSVKVQLMLSWVFKVKVKLKIS